MNQLAKEYIENYLEFANKLTKKALECNKESTGSTIASNEQAIKAAEKAIPMLEIIQHDQSYGTTIFCNGELNGER